MITFLSYQLKVAVLLAALFLSYRLLLSRETFHRFNRAVLITISLLSFILPLIHVTRYSYRPHESTEGKESPKAEQVSEQYVQLESPAIQLAEAQATERVSQAQAYNPPDAGKTKTTTNSSIQQDGNNREETAVEAEQPVRHSLAGKMLLTLSLIYWTGFIVIIVSKVMKILSMGRIINKGRYADRTEGFDLIESDQVPQPLNWMRYIVMPKEWLENLNASVWKHETEHGRKRHSLDLLMADIMNAFQWFNPVVYILRKDFELIHEFEADHAVIETGADAHEYKLMLVEAVASSRGISLTNWLRQSSLKERIDMMDKKPSKVRNRFKALFVPAIATLFLFLNADVVNGKKNSPDSRDFENNVVWVFKGGTAKVKTGESETADMTVDEVPGYLKRRRRKGVSRVTLMYMYGIAGLEEVQPLAERISESGIRISVANNDEMLDRIYMPQYRCARIFDEGNGRYCFELNTRTTYENRKIRREEGMVTGSISNTAQKYEPPVETLKITGDIELMKKWIEMFDGHGVAIYPEEMPYSDAEEIAQTAWKRGINQVSMVSKAGHIVLIPEDSRWTELYPDWKAADVSNERENIIRRYVNQGKTISNPKIFFNSNPRDFRVTHVVRKPDELIVIYFTQQNADLWLTGFNSMELIAGDRRYRQTGNEGLTGFEKEYFWSPDNGIYLQTMHFEPIPDDVKVVNIFNKDVNATVIKGLQVSDDLTYYDNIRTIRVFGYDELKTTHLNESQKDNVRIDRIDLSDDETTVYLRMAIYQPRSFMGYVGSDFTLTLHDGQQVKPVRFEGVPVDREFDRNGDRVETPFQIIFPPLPDDAFNYENVTLTGTVCHEPLRFAHLQDSEISDLKSNLPELLEGDMEQLLPFIMASLKTLLPNINKSYMFGDNPSAVFTMEQRAKLLRRLSIQEQDLDRYISAQGYIIIYRDRNVYISDKEHAIIDTGGYQFMRSAGGIAVPDNPYEYLRTKPFITVDDEGNWYVYGRKAVLWEIN